MLNEISEHNIVDILIVQNMLTTLGHFGLNPLLRCFLSRLAAGCSDALTSDALTSVLTSSGSSSSRGSVGSLAMLSAWPGGERAASPSPPVLPRLRKKKESKVFWSFLRNMSRESCCESCCVVETGRGFGGSGDGKYTWPLTLCVHLLTIRFRHCGFNHFTRCG